MHSIRHLELIRALAQHRHFGHAAAALGVSQPALTRSLKHLEEQLGATIFDRDGVVPTVLGRIILERGERILFEFQEMIREISLAQGVETGELRLVSGPYAADISVQRAIGRLSTHHPGLVVRLRIVDWISAIEAVLAGEADLAVAELSEARNNPELETEPISNAQLYFYCGRDHPLATQPAVNFEDLMDFPWVGPTTPGRMSQAMPQEEAVFGTFDRVHGRFLPRITVETFTAARDIVASGLELGVAVPLQIRREVEAGLLILLPVTPPWLRLNYGFVTRRGRSRSPAALAFMTILRGVEAEIARADDPGVVDQPAP